MCACILVYVCLNVLIKPPPCYTRSLHQEPVSRSKLHLSALRMFPGRSSLQRGRAWNNNGGSAVRERPHVSADASDPPEQVASLSTTLPLTNLRALGWPRGWLSKHDTDRKTVGDGRDGGSQGGRERWEKDHRGRREARHAGCTFVNKWVYNHKNATSHLANAFVSLYHIFLFIFIFISFFNKFSFCLSRHQRRLYQWKKNRAVDERTRRKEHRKMMELMQNRQTRVLSVWWRHSYLRGNNSAIISPEVMGRAPDEAAHKNNVSTPSVVRLSG